MKRLMVAAALTLAATAASAAELTERIDRTFDVRPGSDFVLSNVNGGVKVASWDHPRVRVVAEKRVKAGRKDVEAALRELRVEMQPRSGGLVVTTHYPKRSDGAWSVFDFFAGKDVQAQVRYEVTVPRSMNVDVDNTNGSIRVSRVSGRHNLGTTNGRIEVTASAGSVEASTTNGAIDVELLSVAAGKPLRFSTTNGRIELAVPGAFAANIDAATTNGSITTDLPVATTRVSRNSLRGAINGGGTPVRLRTTNGSIEIRTAQ